MKRAITITMLIGLATILATVEPSAVATHSLTSLTASAMWSTKAPMPSPRDSAAAVTLDGKVYVIGGADSGGALDSMLMYDPVANTWSAKDNMPGPKRAPGAALQNGRIYVVGPPDSQLYEYNPVSDSWTAKSPLPVTPLDKVAVAAISGRIFVAFGVAGDGHPQLYRYDPFQDFWQQLASHPDERSIESLGVANGMIYAVGSALPGQTPSETDRIDRYDPMNNTWTTDVAPRMATGRTHLGPTLPTVDGILYVIGGWNGYPQLSSVEVYDPWSNTWYQEASMPTARYDAAYAVVGYQVYAIGGNRGDASTNWLGANEEMTLPRPPGTENPIAFISARDGRSEIYSINGSGKQEQRLTNDECPKSHVAWTAKARRMLFSASCRWDYDIYSMNPDGSDWRQISYLPGDELRPSMSPDGQLVAFGSNHPAPGWHTYVTNSDGANVRLLTSGPDTQDDSGLTWSPDSLQIVFHSGRSGISQLWRINSDGTHLTQLTDMPDGAFDPAWSPDGTRIAFTSAGDLRLMNPDGTNIRALPQSGDESHPAWSPDGSRIAYASARNLLANDVYVMNRDGTGERRLTTSPGRDDELAWAPPTPYCSGEPSPVDVMLVIDRSGSMSGKPLADEKVAAKGFVDRMNLILDQVGLVSFTTTANLDRQLSHDGDSVKSAIDALVSGKSTNMSAGISTAQSELAGNRHNSAARPVMLLMSDGVPDSSPAALAAAQAAKNAGTRIFTIGLGGVDADLMRRLASSPSDYYFAPTSADLAAIYQIIANTVNCPQPKVKVDPASKRVTHSGGAFTMNVVAEDIINLAAFQVDVAYNPAIVHITQVAPGPFLASTGRTPNPVGPIIDNVGGRVVLGAFTFGAQAGANGTGVLATLTLEPQAVGASALRLQNLQAANPNATLLSSTLAVDGYVEVINCFGDFDGDGDVDILDLQLAASYWNCRAGTTCYDSRFDTEPDGDIDVYDLQRFAAAWGTICGAVQSPGPAALVDLMTNTTNVGLRLSPPSLSSRPDDVFTLTVRAENATNLGAFQTDVAYDPTVVQVEGVAIGPFLGATGRAVTPLNPFIDQASGRITLGALSMGSQPGASGQGDLAYIRLRAQAAGRTAPSLQQTAASDPQGNPLLLSYLEGNEVIVSTQSRVYLPMIMCEQ